MSAGLVGYTVGRKGGRRVLESRFSSERVGQAEAYVREYGFAVLFVGAFAPIPEGYELLSVAAGVFGLRPRTYLLASIVGRGGRYVLEAGLAIAAGEAARSLTEVELYAIIGVVSVVIVGAYLLRDRWLLDGWDTS
ncbi:YqaA family protein [Halococcus qingdaonensis]|uniref:YqaA family protein n=1 Tax=Halococcus qingdaonensis TaxID=224402 RepID=UPI002116827B|nr:VTT domain-containing protein [Halococcus qingdaonensis]